MKPPNNCIYCLQNIANGIGPADMPLATKFLHLLPSSHLFYEDANRHDLKYHIGKTEADRKIADNEFLKGMLYTVKIYCFYSKAWYIMQAYRNYWAVRLFGKKFFNYNGCNGK